jgi:hypothetical protein
MHGFMDGHTRWISEDDEDVDGAGNDDMGPDEEMPDYGPKEEEGLRNGDGEEAVQGGEDADMP